MVTGPAGIESLLHKLEGDVQRLRRLTDRAPGVRRDRSGDSCRSKLRHEIVRTAADIYATHVALIRAVGTLELEARSDAARRALDLSRHLPAPVGDAIWPVIPDPVTRDFFHLYARLTVAQRDALLVIMRRATRTPERRAAKASR